MSEADHEGLIALGTERRIVPHPMSHSPAYIQSAVRTCSPLPIFFLLLSLLCSSLTMLTVFSRPPAEVNYSSPIVTLARELQHEILQYLALSPSRNRPALYIFASTCQALLSISLPFIFYRVHLRPVSGIQASNRRPTLLRALERDVRLRSYIKVVTLDLSHMPSQLGTEQTDYYNTRRILEWLGAVRKLDLQCHSIAGWRELLVDAEGGFSLEPLRALRTVLSSPTLTSLSISGISIPSTIFGLCPHLNALVLESGGALRRCEVDDSER